MIDIDVLALARQDRGRFEWTSVERRHQGYVLDVPVFRDAMKFDDVPELDWAGNVMDAGKRFHGVRLPATAEQLQLIADHVDAMLMTPIVIEEIYLQAKIQFDAIVNSGPPHYTIVADLPITTVHGYIEKAIAALGGDDGSALIACVGKYWCLINHLVDATDLIYGTRTACNFGWCSRAGSGLGVTPRVRCWQRPGYKHPLSHHDPSQAIRLMGKRGRLTTPDGTQTIAEFADIAADPALAPLLHHDAGTLRCLRQPSVPVGPMGGTIVMPELVIEA